MNGSVLLLILLMLVAVIAAYQAGKYIERGRNRKRKNFSERLASNFQSTMTATEERLRD